MRVFVSCGVGKLLAAVFVVVAVGIAWNGCSDGCAFPYDKGEVHVYNLAGERLLAGEEIYRPGDAKPFTYPPFMAVWFAPVALLPHFAVRPLWFGCNLLMLIWVVALLARMLPTGVRSKWFWVFVAVLSGRHVWSVFENESNDLMVLLFAMLGVDAMRRSGARRAGVMFGIGALTKATPLLFLPVAIGQRRFAAASIMLIAMVGAQLTMEWLWPRGDGHMWIAAWYGTFLSGIDAVGGNTESVGNAWDAWNVRNQNLASMIFRLSTFVEPRSNHTFDVSLWRIDGEVLRYATLAARLSVLGVMCWALRSGIGVSQTADEKAFRAIGEGSMVVCGMVLLSPMSSKSHFCVLLLPVAFCCFDYLHREKRGVVLACLLVLLFGALTSQGFVGSDLGYQILARGSVTLCAIAALIGSAVVLRAAARRRVDQSGVGRTPVRDSVASSSGRGSATQSKVGRCVPSR